MLGGEQDYFNFQPDNQIGVGCLQSNADLDQFLPDLGLEWLDDSLNFTTPSVATQFDLGINPESLIDQFNTSDMARGDACDTPIPAADLSISAVGSHAINQYAIDIQSKGSLEVATAGLATWTSNKTVVQHGQITPGESPSPAGISTCTWTSAAKKSRTRRSKADTQDRIGDEKPRRRRKSKKAKTVSPEDQQARRKKFLERNRQAAAKCRSSKKEWQEEQEVKFKDLTLQNAALITELAQVRQQYDSLQSLLIPHRRLCPAEDHQGWVDAREKS